MLQIGLTGGIGSGKSTIAKVLEHMGFPVFYSDTEAKKLYTSHPLLKKELTALFGKAIYKDDVFQYSYLSERLFLDTTLKERVSKLIHPLVRECFNEWASKQSSTMVFNEAAILFETGAFKQFAATILVVAPLETRIQRVQSRDNLSREEVCSRVANQWPDTKKMSLTPYIIKNDGQPLLQQIEKVLLQLSTDLIS